MTWFESNLKKHMVSLRVSYFHSITIFSHRVILHLSLGSDISDLISSAESGESDEFGADSQELIDLFKTILKDK